MNLSALLIGGIAMIHCVYYCKFHLDDSLQPITPIDYSTNAERKSEQLDQEKNAVYDILKAQGDKKKGYPILETPDRFFSSFTSSIHLLMLQRALF
jgi:hypothetical protein